jgi:hypothetical protein
MYFCLNSSETFKWAFWAISSREKCFLVTFGIFCSMFEMMGLHLMVNTVQVQIQALQVSRYVAQQYRIGTIFKATSTTNFNKTPSAKHILL